MEGCSDASRSLVWAVSFVKIKISRLRRRKHWQGQGSADLIVILFCDKHNEVGKEKGDENSKLFKEPAGAALHHYAAKSDSSI